MSKSLSLLPAKPCRYSLRLHSYTRWRPISLPQWCWGLVGAWQLEYPDHPQSYTSGSFTPGRFNQAGKICAGRGQTNTSTLVLQVGGLSMGPATPSYKNHAQLQKPQPRQFTACHPRKTKDPAKVYS